MNVLEHKLMYLIRYRSDVERRVHYITTSYNIAPNIREATLGINVNFHFANRIAVASTMKYKILNNLHFHFVVD